jgi:hypothetical protein
MSSLLRLYSPSLVLVAWAVLLYAGMENTAGVTVTGLSALAMTTVVSEVERVDRRRKEYR